MAENNPEAQLQKDIDIVLHRLEDLQKRSHYLRLGQLFINIMGFKVPWPELFYYCDQEKARDMIKEFLIDNQCPDKLNRAITDLEERDRRLNESLDKSKSND